MGRLTWHARGVLVLAATRVCIGSAQDLDEMMARTEEEREARLEETIRKHMKMMEDGGVDSELPFPGSVDGMPDVPVAHESSKQIAVKKAKSFMREVVAALSTSEAEAKINEARGAAAADFLEAPDEDDDEVLRGEGSDETNLAGALFAAVGPVVDKLTQAVVSKYGFEGGFEQAINSVEEAMQRKGNKELQTGLKFLADMFAPANPARVPALHRAAHQFLRMRRSQQDAAIARAEELLAKSSDDARAGIKEILAVMQGVLAHGNSHVRDSILELVQGTREVARNEAHRPTDKDREAFDLRMDVMMQFLSPQERADVEKELTSDEPRRSEL